MMTTRGCSEIKPGVPAPGMAARIGATIDTRRGVEYRELRAASLVNRFNARWMPFGWTANPYRGCEMACRYCYARYTHEFLGQNDPQTFERQVYVKKTERAALLAELRRARRSGLLVAVGTATHPYQPAEARFEVTRRLLEAARDVPGVRLSITTKGTLVERDVALLAEIARGSELSVNFSITTADPALARRLEPRAPRPDLRFGAMAALAPAYRRLYASGAYAAQAYVGTIEARVRRLGAQLAFPTRGRCDRPAAGRSPRQLALVW